MEPADAQALASRLAAKSISYQISPDGKTVSVPGDKVDSSRLEVASEGMPHSGRLGFELFDKLNWGQTEFDEKVNYQRALEGELERTIQTLRDVESVRVHLVIPKSFNDAQQIADKFKDSIPVILNLQGVDSDLSKRLIDFASGLTYALDGGMQRIADKVFMLTPHNVEISAEERARLIEKGFFNQS